MPFHLYLIRHGETEWSLSGKHTGLTDIPLTAHGEEEARELSLRLQSTTFTHVVSSPLQRAMRTCELSVPDATPEIDSDLAEWNYGDFEGLSSDEILLKQPDWNIFSHGGPNGETPAQVCERADRLIARLRTLGGNVAVFSHGHFGRVLAARWINLPVVAGQHFKLGTASLSIFGYDPHHTEVPVISLWNATPPSSNHPKAKAPIERWENEGGEIPDQ